MATHRKFARLGWRPDPPDRRDHRYAAKVMSLARLPASLRLDSQFAPPYDQADTSSCTGNASASVIQRLRRLQNLPDTGTPSRLMAYFNGRLMEGATDQDAGAVIRDVIKGLALSGVCPETLWPFNSANVCVAPPETAYDAAAASRALSYASVDQSEVALKMALFEGLPVIFGFMVYPYFMSDAMAKSGILTMPGVNEASVGGHCVVIVGYDDTTRRFLVRNSWSVGWGIGGYFWMPYEYVLDAGLSSDFWVIKAIGVGAAPVPEIVDPAMLVDADTVP